jgi:peptide/nickel transport system substrate-binding protein
MKHTLSRRSFLKTIGAAAAATTLHPFTQSFGGFALAQASKPLTIGFNAEPLSLDPHHAAIIIVHYRVFNFIFDQLTQTNANGVLQPMLATSWASEGNQWRFQLRPDVVFQNGSVMTADDVVFSFERLLFGENESRSRSAFAPFIERVEATDELEVTFTSPRPDPLLPLRLAVPFACVMPRDYVEGLSFDALQTAPVGAGPYKVTEFIPGERLVMEQHREYWGGVPEATEVTLRLIPEEATRIAALLGGDVDFITTVSPDSLRQIDTGETRIDTVNLLNWMLIHFNTTLAPTSNVHLRKALSLAIDRNLIIQELWGDRVQPMTDYFLPNEFGFDPQHPPFVYDPEAAMEELQVGGYAGEAVEFNPPNTYYPNSRLVGDVINDMWAAIGVNVNYEPLETAQWGERVQGGSIISTLTSFATSGDAATSSITQSWAEGGIFRPYYAPPAPYEQLVLEAAASSDNTVRMRNYRQLVAILDEDMPIAPLYQSVEFYGLRDGISWQPHPRYFIDLRPNMFSF